MVNDPDSAFTALQSMPGSVTILEVQQNHGTGLEGLVIFKKTCSTYDRNPDEGRWFSGRHRQRAKSSAYAVFAKPFDVDLLLRLIHDTLERRCAGR